MRRGYQMIARQGYEASEQPAGALGIRLRAALLRDTSETAAARRIEAPRRTDVDEPGSTRDGRLNMGVNLTPISLKRNVALAELDDRRLAVDALGEIYQFLALIRLPDGTPLGDRQGHVTSHLAGLLYRTTRLIAEHRLHLIFVFDGKPPALKAAEIERRRHTRERYSREHAAAVAAGDLRRAYSKSTMTSRLTADMLDDA